jgi:hypothetical protein
MRQDVQLTSTDRPSGGGGRPTRDGAEPGTEVLFLGGSGLRIWRAGWCTKFSKMTARDGPRNWPIIFSLPRFPFFSC